MCTLFTKSSRFCTCQAFYRFNFQILLIFEKIITSPMPNLVFKPQYS
jgi:hypothetical protein